MIRFHSMADTPKSEFSQEAQKPLKGEVSPELLHWLRDARLDAEEAEEANAEPICPPEDYPLETAGFDPFEFQLANGHDVKIVFAKFWARIRYQDWQEGARPARYRAIKIYCTEDTLPRSMAIHCEFRAGKEFILPAVPKIWDWLEELVISRRFAQFDSVADFIDDLAEQLTLYSDIGEDAVEHVQHLPEIATPKAFDHDVDDSVYNDQNEPDERKT